MKLVSRFSTNRILYQQPSLLPCKRKINTGVFFAHVITVLPWNWKKDFHLYWHLNGRRLEQLLRVLFACWTCL